jgi:hypothetical protein
MSFFSSVIDFMAKRDIEQDRLSSGHLYIIINS